MDPAFDLTLKALVAMAPVLLLLLVFDRLDVFNLINMREISLLIVGGGALAALGFVLSWVILAGQGVSPQSYSRYGAPVIEETIKAAPIIALYAHNRLGFKIDAAIAGFAVGAGFALVENAWYFLTSADANVSAWIVRGFGTAVMHSGASALFAVITHEMSERQAASSLAEYRFDALVFAPGLAVAVVVHSAFNHFPNQSVLAMGATFLLVPLTLFLTLARSEAATKKWLKADHAAHMRTLADIRSGHFAESELGQSIRHIAHKVHGVSQADALAFLELKLELVLKAEELILASHDGAAVSIDPSDRDRFARLDALRARLGKSAVAELNAEFGFSRNDVWELGRLRARVFATSAGETPPSRAAFD
jgi:RsiW-degrading membrane proteinase PrsW (M82 family)